MSLTNAETQADLNRRLGPYAALADLPSALSWAAREVVPSVGSASPFAITDAELVAVTTDQFNQFLDLAEYRATVTILHNLSDDALRQIGVTEEVRNVHPTWERKAKRLRDDLTEKYGYGLMSLQSGVMDLGFAETLRCDLPTF